MYYLIYNKSNNDYAIRSFPKEKCSLWEDNMLRVFNVNRDMVQDTSIVDDTIEEYLSSRKPIYLTVLISWETCPTLEQAQQEYPELFI